MKDRYPEWMKKYRHDPTIYGMFEKDRLDDLTQCAFDYLDIYLPLLWSSSEPITDADKLAHIRGFHDQFKDDIRTQDKAQGMMAKFIGQTKGTQNFL